MTFVDVELASNTPKYPPANKSSQIKNKSAGSSKKWIRLNKSLAFFQAAISFSRFQGWTYNEQLVPHGHDFGGGIGGNFRINIGAVQSKVH